MAFDLGLCAVVLVLLNHLGLSPLLLVVYAWSPLVIKETMNSAHYDVVPAFCMVLAVVLMVKGRDVLAHISLAAAVLGKLYPVLLVPVFLACAWKAHGWGRALLGLSVTVAVLIIGYAPFWSAGRALWTGTQTFAEQWQTNSLIFPGIVALVGERWLANGLVGLGLGGVALLVCSRSELADDRQFVWSNGLLLGLLFLLSPVGNPWYFVCLVPFLAVFPPPFVAALIRFAEPVLCVILFSVQRTAGNLPRLVGVCAVLWDAGLGMVAGSVWQRASRRRQ